jgi:hypothetical protein
VARQRLAQLVGSEEDLQLLPAPIREQLHAVVPELSQIVGELQEELRLGLPPIEVLPICLLLGWSPPAVVPALASFRVDGSLANPVIQLSAPAALHANRDETEAILMHEFLHVIHESIRIVNATTRSAEDRLISVPSDECVDYLSSPAQYASTDARLQVSPVGWLSPRLENVLREVRFQRLAELVETTWLDEQLPTSLVDPRWRLTEVTLDVDDLIIERAARLGLCRIP